MAGGTFSSLEAILEDIRKCAKQAVEAVHSQAEQIEQSELQKFYDSGKPKVYVRSGALLNSRRVGPFMAGGDIFTFEGYLETGGIHPNADKLVTMGDVIEATHNNPSHWNIKGRYKYWDGAEKKLAQALDKEMAKYFD